MAVTTRLDTITPAKAQKWLDNRAENRPLREAYAKKLAAAMEAGEWEINGENVKFNKDEKLIDGQHRCLGVVISGVTIQSFVTRGLSNSSFDTIDIGTKRTAGAIYAKHGETNANLLAAAVAWLWRYEQGHIEMGRSVNPRIKESLELLERTPGIRDSCLVVGNCRKLMYPSMAVCLHYLFQNVDKVDADEFFHHLLGGENINKGDRTSSIYRLRAILASNSQSSTKLKASVMWAITVKAFNAYRAEEVVKSLRFVPGHENFPTIK